MQVMRASGKTRATERVAPPVPEPSSSRRSPRPRVSQMRLHRGEHEPPHGVGAAAEEQLDLVLVEIRRALAQVAVRLVVEVASVVARELREPAPCLGTEVAGVVSPLAPGDPRAVAQDAQQSRAVADGVDRREDRERHRPAPDLRRVLLEQRAQPRGERLDRARRRSDRGPCLARRPLQPEQGQALRHEEPRAQRVEAEGQRLGRPFEGPARVEVADRPGGPRRGRRPRRSGRSGPPTRSLHFRRHRDRSSSGRVRRGV